MDQDMSQIRFKKMQMSKGRHTTIYSKTDLLKLNCSVAYVYRVNI